MTRARELAELAAGYDSGGLSNMRNRIINGNMVIDQRNAGAAVTLTALAAATGYGADRWYAENFTDGTATIQQITDAPTGFSNSIRYTVTATDSSLASDQSAFIQQRIEGFNSADLAFGSASAQTITLSFWVKSSVTGTFGGALANNAYNRGYPFTFTISAANTWEQKSITIAGDTTGTWVGSTNGVGLRVTFALAAGSARVSTAGVWAAYVGIGASGQVNLMATNSATFQVTGVQLEKGSTATSFDVRPYTTELALCQRYFHKPNFSDTSSSGTPYVLLQCSGSTQLIGPYMLPVTMRSTPTLTYSGFIATTANNSSAGSLTSLTLDSASTQSFRLIAGVSSGLVAGNASFIQRATTSDFMAFSAEL
jgi:hypothetical protein